MQKKNASIAPEYSKRIHLARILFIILVVYVHVPLDIPTVRNVADFSLIHIAYIFSETLLRFSVTILTVLSGYIFFATRADERGFDAIGKKVKTLVIPFLCWNIPLVLLLYFGQKFDILNGQRLDLTNGDWRVWMDAAFAYSTRPVNYPLYFLRDLFVISVLAVLLSKLARTSVITMIALSIIVSAYNLDGNLILRTPMLIAFYIGAALAIYKVRLDVADEHMVWYWPALLVACVAQYYYPNDGVQLLIAILGGVAFWSLTSLVGRVKVLSKLADMGGYAFPIYLMHGAVIFLILGLGFKISHSATGFITWLVVPPVICIVCVLAFRAMNMISPKLTSFSTGGRGS